MWGIATDIKAANKPNNVMLFFNHRNFMSDICILTNTKWWGKKLHKIKEKKPNKDSININRCVDTQVSPLSAWPCEGPHFKKYTLVHTHAHTPRLTELNDSIQAFVCNSEYEITSQHIRLQSCLVCHFLGWVWEFSSSLRENNCWLLSSLKRPP